MTPLSRRERGVGGRGEEACGARGAVRRHRRRAREDRRGAQEGAGGGGGQEGAQGQVLIMLTENKLCHIFQFCTYWVL